MGDEISPVESPLELENGGKKLFRTNSMNGDRAVEEEVSCRILGSNQLDEELSTSFPMLPSANYQPHARSCLASDLGHWKAPFPSSIIMRVAWALLLTRYTDHRDVIFGTSGAETPALENATMDMDRLLVPLWVRIDYEKPIGQFIRDFERQFQTAVCKQRSVWNSTSIRPKNASLESATAPLNAIFFSDRGSQPEELSDTLTKYALSLNCSTTDDGLHVVASFDENMMDRKQIGRMLNQLKHVIRQLCNHTPDKTLGDIDIISPEDMKEIQEWNREASAAMDTCVHYLFEQRAEKSPNAIAVHAHDGDLSYQELNNLSSHLAQYLTTIGVRNDSFVAVCFEKSKWAIVAMMAVLKAGSAIVPLDHSHPVMRLKSIIENSGTQVVLCSPSQRELLEQTGIRVVVVDTSSLSNIPKAGSRTREPVSSSSAAFVFFTSGSTGTPKGIIITHTAYCTSARSHSKALRISEESRVMQFAAYTYDVSVGEIFTTLIYGGCICVPSNHDRVNNLAASIRNMGVTWMFLTPSVASLLQPKDVPNLKTLVLGGEPATRQNFITWANDVYLINSYGPAECSIWTHCNPGVSRDTSVGYIGRNINGVSWIADAADPSKLVPIGTVGELLIEGPILARGYLNDRAKTEAAFIEAPAWHTTEKKDKTSRLYRTGDLVKYDSDGAIIILGRRDTQVKLRGQRVELGEIEFHIQQSLPKPGEVVVDVIKQKDSDHSVLIAFISVDHNNGAIKQQDNENLPAPQSLQEEYPDVELHLSRFLPRHMIPSVFVPVPIMPLTTSGKINRKKLRDLAAEFSSEQLTSGHSEHGKVLPSGEMELKLQSLWGSILSIPEAFIGAKDSFFRLGGDSLQAMKLVSAANDVGIHLSVADVFNNPKLSDLAQHIGNTSGSKSKGRISPFSLLKDDWVIEDFQRMAAGLCKANSFFIEDAYPATPLQEGLMALSTKHIGSYVSQQILKLGNNVDVDLFCTSWDSVVSKNPILRTRLLHTELDGTIQVVLSKVAKLQVTNRDLESFLEADRQIPMDFGDSLSRYSIIHSETSDEYHFVWTCHHALYDGWSLPLIFKHLRDEYEFGATTSYQVPQFQGFVEYLKGIDAIAQQEYWRDQFSGSSPSDLVSFSSTYQPCADKTLSMMVPIVRRLRSETTLPTLIRGAWALVIASYTGSSDVIFGCVLNGRNAPVPGIDKMAAPTIATVPIRVKLDGTQNISDYLHGLQSQSNGMIPYEQTGLQNIKLACPESRTAADFQTLLVVEMQKGDAHDKVSSLEMEDISTSRLDFTRYPVTLVCNLGVDQVELDIKFDSELIPAIQMQRIMNHFKNVFGELCREDPRLRVEDVNRLSPEDLTEIVSWNGTLPDTVDSCLHDFIDQCAVKNPNAVAVDSWDGQLTYDELRLQSLRLAGYLITRGVGSGTMVPMCFEKSRWAVVGMMGVLRAGGACVPLDPSYPRSRLETILARLKAQVLLTSPLHAPELNGIDQRVIVLNSDLLDQAPAETTPTLVHPTDAAFVLHTSGSTGIPKAIVLEHRALCTSLHAHGAVECLGPESRVVQFAAYTFDVSISDIFATLIYGGCICIPSERQRLNDLARFINNKRINQAGLTPAVANLLTPSEVPCLKYLKLGGETMTQDNVLRWSTKVNLLNSYGQAECSIKSAYNAWMGPDSDPSTIGKPVGGALWIVQKDDHRQLVPIGVIGELVVEGDLLAREYLDDPQKTEDAFPSSPKWLQRAKGRRGERIFKSGDLAKYNPDGSIKYIGRKDTQVKLRGQRLELGDVEYHLQQCVPSFTNMEVQLAVELVTPADGEPMLAAFLSAKEDLSGRENDFSEAEEREPVTGWLVSQVSAIKVMLSNVIPNYMIPSAFISLDQMPLSTSGKIDRKELRNIASNMSMTELLALSASSRDIKPPETEMQQRLHALWSTTLNISPNSFGIEDTLFQLGGDSITAIKLVTAARTAGLLLSVQDIFKQPKLSDMALIAHEIQEQDVSDIPAFALIKSRAVLGVDQHLSEVAALCGVGKDNIEDVYPCTPLQEGLMALSLTDHGAYIAQMVFEVPATLDTDRLLQSWEAVFKHHAILRSRMVRTNDLGTVLVVIKNFAPFYSGSVELEPYLQQDKQIPMGYGDSLSHCAVISDEKTGNRYVVLRIHHVLYDGWSMSRIFRDLEHAYTGSIRGSTVGYSHFIKYLIEADRASSELFWIEEVANAPAQSFPSLPSITYRPFASAEFRHSFALPNNALRANYTVSTKILAAWSLVFGRYSDMSDVIFGTTVSGRSSSVRGIESIVGPTLATVPFRVQFQSEQSILDLLHVIQKRSGDMMPHEHIGIQNIRGLGADGRRACEFQVLLNIHSSSEPGTKSVLGLRELSGDLANFHTYAVNLQFNIFSGGMGVYAQFDQQVVESTQMERIVKQLEHVFRQIYHEPSDAKVGDISLVSPADMQQLEQWNSTLPPAVDSCVHQLIEERVQLHPQKQAVTGWDGQFTYEQLDNLAHKLACHLVNLGIKPEKMVPVCFEKSIWTIVAILGVLKAGAAFVSMDPSHPVNRLETIINDVEAMVILSSEKTSKIFSESIKEKILIVDAPTIDSFPEGNAALETGVTLQNAVYVIFTSGSTGNPKGAIIEHRAYSSSAVECARELHIHSESRVLQFASYSFDVSIQEILATLIVGGCICVPDEIDRLNDISRLINELEVTWMNPTPSFARMITAESIPNVETMVLGGEAPRRDDIDYWASKLRLVNAYGLSECSVTNVINVGVGVGAESRNIGRAVACATWVVDPDNHERLAPLGSVGELLIEGHVLAREYLNNADKTAAVFIPAPGWLRRFRPGSTKVYKTGDLVRYCADGTIYYIGRKDSQVKLHGQRFELGEIEHHLRACMPSTEVAAEIVTPVGRSTPILVGFVMVGNVDNSATVTEEVAYTVAGREALSRLTAGLSSRLAQSLPSYMIPSLFIPLRRMPLSVAGKTDRNRLRRLVSDMTVEQISSFTAAMGGIRRPSTLTEIAIRDLWADNLGLDPDSIGLDDNYFQLGGDSITAMFLVAVSQAEGVLLTVASIFKHPVLSELALSAQCTDQFVIPEIPPFQTIPQVEDVGALLEEVAKQYGYTKHTIEDIYPCTPLQDGLVAISIKEPGTYLAQAAWSLPESLDIDRYRGAWDAAVQNMSILRTRIIETSAGLMQVILDSPVEWQAGRSLQGYLKSDREEIMGLGEPLIRFAIINESEKQYFVWTAHHALIDGWTAQIIQENVERAYHDASLKPTLSFNHFISHINQIDWAGAEEFWKSELADSPLPSFPELPSDNYRPITDAGLMHTVKFSRRTDSEIPVSAIIKGAWSLILSRYSDSAEVVFGHTTNGRTTPVLGIDRLVGPTIATVPFRVRFDSNWQVGDFLKEIQRLSTSAMPFEQTGLQNIRKMGAGARAACQFQNMLLIQNSSESGVKNASLDDDDADKVVVQGVDPVEVTQTKFHAHALVVECALTSEGASIKVEFDSRVIDEAQMWRIVRQFGYVMQQLSGCSPEASLRDIDMISSEELVEISKWNSEVPQVISSCFHHLLDDRMEEYADAPALVSTSEQLLYRELNQASKKLAYRLIELGVGPEVFVPLCFEKSVWAVVAMLAVWKAGGACVSLDPSHPEIRHKAILLATSARVALTSPAHASSMRHLGLDVTVVDKEILQDLSPDIPSPATNVSPSNAAYAVFTSGSTGVPKAIVVEHASLSTSSTALAVAMKLGKSSRVLQFAAYTFDVSFGDICPTLLLGGCVCVPTDYERLDSLANTITSLQVNQIQLTPSVAARLEPSDVGQLRVLAVGGEAVTKAVLEKWAEKTHLINIYGPAECTIWCAGQNNVQRTDDPSRIGRGISAVAWVVDKDDHNKLAPIGTIGELVIEGPGLARGYLNDRPKTEAAFINNPEWSSPSGSIRRPSRIYKTGDLVKYMTDGSLKYIARKDTQVKLRGQRIELGEVEFQLKNCFSSPIDLAVEVVAPADANDSSLLAAFIVMGEDSESTSENEVISSSESSTNQLKGLVDGLEAKLLQVLPGYMIPSAFIPVTKLPLSTSAKLDRKYLRETVSKLSKEQLFAFMATAKDQVPPSTKAEIQVQKLWAKVLGIETDKIGADDSFFRLGGDSLDAMHLSNLAQSAGLQLTVANIFRFPVLAAMADNITAVGEDVTQEIKPFSILREPHNLDDISEAAIEQCGLSRDEIEDVYPCTPLQVEFMQNSISYPGYFSIQFIYSLTDDVDLERLRRAWDVVAASHMILRTRIIQTSSFFQVVTKSSNPCGTAHNLESYLSNDVKEPLGLGQPLTRCAIVNDDATGKRYWVWTTHHATYDGWSRQLLLRELQRAYRDSTPSIERAKFNSYVRCVADGDLSASDSFWSSQLAGSTAKPFGTWSPSYQPAAKSTLQHTISNAEKMHMDVTLPTVLQGAWALVVANYMHSDEVILKLTLTGRNAPVPGIEHMMGPTATMVPQRLRVDTEQHTHGFLQGIQNWWVEASQFEHIGWQRIRNLSSDAARACNAALPLVIHPQTSGSSTEFQFDSARLFRAAPCQFLMDCYLTEAGVAVSVYFDVIVFEVGAMKGLLAQFDSVFQQLCRAGPDHRLEDVLMGEL
ncbi:nonribosomal peptide synthase [Trichoderma arundinaceum]|uniref:Nonribosomal peptide synthase n=1 Tax=Trichoderma arundinaceum TaxID=490622 RepID=A0A395NBQ6_TRIAR|nr:nonribosomal peptide synthase [Trichoderma arundinaceum]